MYSRILTLIFLLLISATTQAQKALDFSLSGDNGTTIKLSSYKNQIVYVDFWASWCKPCRQSFPFLNEMHQRYASKGLKIIAINLDDNKKAAAAFLKKYPASFTIAYDPEGKTPSKYGLKVMPTSYLIDRRGQIINIHKGFKEDQAKALENMISQSLNKRLLNKKR